MNSERGYCLNVGNEGSCYRLHDDHPQRAPAPLFYVVFKLTLFLAIVLAMAIGILLGITIVGRIVRYVLTGK